MTRLSIIVTSLAVLLVQIGTASTHAQAPAAAANAKKVNITFKSLPAPSKTGDNTVEVTVTDLTGQPVTNAEVSAAVVMTAMPSMHSEVKLKPADTGKPADAGKYTGTVQLMMAGAWTVTVSVKQDGKEIGQSKATLTTK